MSTRPSRRAASSAPVENFGSENAGVINVARVGQTLPPSPARLRVLPTPGNALPPHLSGEYVSAEVDEETQLEPASPTVRAVEGPKSRKKKTADVRWTQHMRDKLVQQVFYLKAYKRTKNETKQQKFQRIKETLEGDREFLILGRHREVLGVLQVAMGWCLQHVFGQVWHQQRRSQPQCP